MERLECIREKGVNQMKCFVLTKRRMIGIAAILAVFIGIIAVFVSCMRSDDALAPTAEQTAAAARKIPIYCVGTDEKKIAISFDAAWGNEQTEELIEILDTYGVKTTFFVVGDWVDKYPESVKALHEAGHEVCNHSNTHPYMTKLSQSDQIEELQSCNEKIEAITGVSPQLFRPPYGDYDNSVVESVESLQMYPIQWDVDSLDWKDPTVEQMVERVTSNVQNGSIVLFHNGAKNTPAALPIILEKLQGEGYEIVPISELILKENYTIDGTGKQISNTQKE